MPLPWLPLLGAFALGKASKKTEKRQAVSKHTRKNGTKVKAYTRKSK